MNDSSSVVGPFLTSTISRPWPVAAKRNPFSMSTAWYMRISPARGSECPAHQVKSPRMGTAAGLSELALFQRAFDPLGPGGGVPGDPAPNAGPLCSSRNAVTKASTVDRTGRRRGRKREVELIQ
ncbi:MAG TPA: hypothetical protein VFI00_09940 [Kribbella sp.]|nr:hypothetical protein [Kribbella sp.]